MGSTDESTDPSEGLLTVYKEVCNSHRKVTDFRGKLLGYLPLAAGGGLFLLSNQRDLKGIERHFVFIGLFGIVVTIGLFIHELPDQPLRGTDRTGSFAGERTGHEERAFYKRIFVLFWGGNTAVRRPS